MKGCVQFLASSYGPKGKTKLIRLPTGNITITRDGMQLLQALTNHSQTQERAFESMISKLTLESSISIGDRFGDGSLTSFLISTVFLSNLEVLGPAHNKIQMNRAIRTLLFAVQQGVREALVVSRCWITISNCFDMLELQRIIRSVLVNTLTPSAAPLLVEAAERLMMDWIEALFAESSELGSATVLHHGLTQILRHFEELLVICDAVPKSSRESRVLPKSELILPGRMLDWHDTKKVEICQLPEPAGTSGDNSHTSSLLLCRGVCIKNLIDAGVDESNKDRVVLVVTPTAESTEAMLSLQLRVMRRLCKELESHKVGFLFCCCSVEGQCRHEAALHGIVLVDCISDSGLNLLSTLGGCTLWDTAADALETLQSSSTCFNTDSGCWLHFKDARRFVQSADRNVHISGILGAAHHSARQGYEVPQLLIHGSNPHELGLIVQLMKKAVKALLSCCKRVSPAPATSAATAAVVAEEWELVICPGAGVMEELWAEMWSRVADWCRRCDGHTYNGNGFETTKLAAVPLDNMVSVCTAAVWKQLSSQFLSRQQLCRSLHILADVCTHLSHAYHFIYQQLERNNHSSVTRSTSRDIATLLGEWVAAVESDGDEPGRVPFVAGSAQLFWEVFMFVMENALMVSRTDPVVAVVRKLAKPTRSNYITRRRRSEDSEHSEVEDSS